MNRIDLLTPHNADKPRFRALVTAVLSQSEEWRTLLESLPTEWSLEHATGAQLDIIGSLIHVPRPLKTTSDRDFRLYLRAKIAGKMWDGSNATYPETLSRIFPDREVTYTDNQNGTVSVTVSGDPLPFPLSDLIPLPVGIRPA